MAALEAVLAGARTLPGTLNLCLNALGLGGIQALAAALPSASQLQALHLQQAQLESAGAALMAPCLASLAPTLQTLWLQDTQLRSAGAVALAPALQALTGLNCLALGRGIDGKGVQAIAPALAGMCGLQQLMLLGNKMGASGAAALAQALPAFAGSLERLDSSWCGMCSEGAAALAPALAQCTGLVELSLAVEKFAPHAVHALCAAFESMRLLKEAEMFCEQWGEGGYLSLIRVLGSRDALPKICLTSPNAQCGLGWASTPLHNVQDAVLYEVIGLENRH